MIIFKYNIWVNSVPWFSLQPIPGFLKMIVLWQLCTVAGFKVRVNILKEAISWNAASPTSRFLRNYSSLTSWDSGTVINHIVLSLPSCKSDMSLSLTSHDIPLPSLHNWSKRWARSKPLREIYYWIQEKKNEKLWQLSMIWGFRATFPTTLTAEKESHPEEKRAKKWSWWLSPENMNLTITVLCVSFHVSMYVSQKLSSQSKYLLRVSSTCYRILTNTETDMWFFFSLPAEIWAKIHVAN